jgi:hypothetical protein
MPDYEKIIRNASAIIANIEAESLDVYLFLIHEYDRGDIRENRVFQFLFRSFYRLDSAGLTPDFKQAFFKALEEKRGQTEVDLDELVRRFYKDFPNRKGQQSLQFSFMTKLANMINKNYPIYDAEIARIFHFSAPYNKTFDVRLKAYLTFYESMKNCYAELLNNQILIPVLSEFKKHYPQQADKIPFFKKVDFILWSAGKLFGSNI